MTCLECGRCCTEKAISYSGEVFYTPWFCKHFDPETRRCRVYERRHEMEFDCLSVAEGIEAGAFPPDCPYVRNIPGYTPPRTDWWNDEPISRIVQQGDFDAQFLPDLYDELFGVE